MKKDKKPKVSVIVPVYNGKKHLDECIASICGQTMKELQIICVNDGSTDNSLEILKKWQKADSRIEIINIKNHGTGYAINTGIGAAFGEYIAEVDCDDFVDPDMYEYLYSIADGADVVKSGYYSYYCDGRDYPYSLVDKNQTFRPIDLDYMTRRLVFNFQPSFWTAIYRTEFIEDNHLYWNETPGASFQDTSIIFKINALCRKMVWTDRSFYHWRVGETHSITGTKWPMAVIYEYGVMEEFLNNHEELLLPLRDILSRMRFGTYSWNLTRIKDKDRDEFVKKAAADLQRDNDYQDVRYYTEDAWKNYLIWMKEPDRFLEAVRKAEENERAEKGS